MASVSENEDRGIHMLGMMLFMAYGWLMGVLTVLLVRSCVGH
jgi:hypothetical protein